MPNTKLQDQAAFLDVVYYGGLAWKYANRLLCRTLTPPQREATLTLVNSLGRFTLSLQTEIARQPVTIADGFISADAAHEAPRIGARPKPEHPHYATVKALGLLWVSLHAILFGPNRLDEAQRALGVAVLHAANDFTSEDFGSVTKEQEAEGSGPLTQTAA